MTRTYTRRRAILTTAAVLLGGCLGRGEENSPAEGDDEGDTPTVTPTSTPGWDEESLRETGALDGQLVDLITAADREAVANDHGMEYRPEDGMVRVSLELEPDGEFPEGYRTEDIERYQQRVTGHVHVDDLASLAMDEDVRIIRPYEEPKTTKISSI